MLPLRGRVGALPNQNLFYQKIICEKNRVGRWVINLNLDNVFKYTLFFDVTLICIFIQYFQSIDISIIIIIISHDLLVVVAQPQLPA